MPREDIPYLDTTGPGDDLETFAYIRRVYPILPQPRGTVKFHIQGQPIPDQQVHVVDFDLQQMLDPANPNPRIVNRFRGTNIYQNHKPDHLSSNEINIVE